MFPVEFAVACIHFHIVLVNTDVHLVSHIQLVSDNSYFDEATCHKHEVVCGASVIGEVIAAYLLGYCRTLAGNRLLQRVKGLPVNTHMINVSSTYTLCLRKKNQQNYFFITTSNFHQI